VSDDAFNDKVLATVQVIDVVATARALGMDLRALSGRPTPEHDYRFSMPTPTGGEVTFNRYATAEQVAAYCEHEGWLPS
jgi:hypothetical protein